MPELEDHSAGEQDVFEITVERDPQDTQVRVFGELDIATVLKLNRVLDELEDDGLARLVLDLEGVGFMDCMGIFAIVLAQHAAVRNGHRLVVRSSSRQVRRLFELTNVFNYLTFE